MSPIGVESIKDTCKSITVINPPPSEMQDSGYHCMKDLVCGVVDKADVEAGLATCGFLVNGISFGLLFIQAILKL